MTMTDTSRPAEWFSWTAAVQDAWTRHADAQDEAHAATTRLREYLPVRLDALLLDCDSSATAEMVAFAALLLTRLVAAYPDAEHLAAWLLAGEDNGEPHPG